MNIISALNIKGKGSIFNLSVFRQKLLAKTLHSRRKWQDGQTSVYHTQKDSWTLHAQIPPKECLTFETFWPARNLINFVWISQFWKWTWVIWKYRKFKRKLIDEFLLHLQYQHIHTRNMLSLSRYFMSQLQRLHQNFILCFELKLDMLLHSK